MTSFKYAKRKISGISIAILCTFCILGTAIAFHRNQPSDFHNNSLNQMVFADGTEESFEEALEKSNFVFEGTFDRRTDYGTYYELGFKVDQVFKGTSSNDYVTITCQNESVQTPSPLQSKDYVKGEKYVLVTSRSSLVYYPEDRYTIIDNLFIPADNLSASKMYGRKAAVGDWKNLVAKQGSSSEDCHIISKFTQSSDLSDALAISDVVLKVKVTECLTSSDMDGTETFSCEVIDTIKGTANDKNIIVVFFAGSVSVGNEYVVIANAVSPDSFVYTLSAEKNCVIPSSDAEKITAISNYQFDK